MYKQAHWHTLSSAEVIKELKSRRSGLESADAKKRLKKFGPNEIPEKNGKEFLIILGNQLRNPFFYILIGAGLISFFLKAVIDAAVIFIAVILNVIIGFVQEWKASNIFNELKKFLTYKAVVLRDKKIKHIDSREIVVGDILILRQGDRVPADARLIKISNFKTNESLLTGESTPVEKMEGILQKNTAVADQINMVFLGTFAEEGLAEAVVIATGLDTEFGKLASLVRQKTKSDTTPLQAKLKSMAKFFGIVFVIISAMLFVLGIIAGQDVFNMFLTSVAVAVAAVPESLPVALTVALAVGAGRILNKGGLVRKVIAAEALGSTNTIATDKTGTLTEGKMHIVKLINRDGRELLRDSFKPDEFNLRLLTLISNASIENISDPKEKWRVYGRPIDKAIILSSAEVGINKDDLHAEMPRLSELPFDARYRYSAVLNRLSDGKNIISVLGAPEVVGGDLKNVSKLAAQGFKVLSLAFKEVPSSVTALDRSLINNLIFSSLIALADPIREEVKESIRIAESAGLNLVMVTGDHSATAHYVAKELGIKKVFSRVTPEEKVKIIASLQNGGRSVAMIGDGVNDVPALLQSDIGVALGSGTDVAKEAADLVLINDSFSIIVEAIRQGRIILDNIKKVLIFLLSSAFSEIVLVGGSILLGLPLPILPAQILWVNIIEDGLPAIALAFENDDAKTMERKPEKTSAIFNKDIRFLIGSFAVIADLALFSLFFYLLKAENIDYVRTMIFVGLGLTSLFYVFSIRSLKKPLWRTKLFSNKFLNWSVITGLIMYLGAVYFDPLTEILRTVPLSFNDWLILLSLGVFNILVIEVAKALFLYKRY